MPSDPSKFLLNDSNYADWEIYTRAGLVQKEVWDVVDGTDELPQGSAASAKVKAFRKRQNIAHAFIVMHVEPSQLPHCRDADPKVVWDTLRTVHMARGFGSRQSMMRRFVNAVKPTEQSMSAWVAEVRHRAFVLAQNAADVTDQWTILALTNGLDESYHATVESLDSVDPELLTVDYVVTRLLNAAATKQIDKEDDVRDREEGSAMAARRRMHSSAQKGRSSTPSSQTQCYRCKGYGHISRDCATPEDVDRGDTPHAHGKSAVCHHCGSGNDSDVEERSGGVGKVAFARSLVDERFAF